MADSITNVSDWCRIDAAAAYLGVSTSFLRKMVRERRIPFARAGSKVLLFRRKALDVWLEPKESSEEITHLKQ